MSAVKVALQRSQKSGGGGSKPSSKVSAEASPDSKCPICLDAFNNISYLDVCLHKFCFRCIQEWSKNKAECPLCKQPFASIYHSVKSDQDFQKYDLRPADSASFGTFEGVRFRYRTTLTGVRRHLQGRTSLPPDSGVMFEASRNPPQQQPPRDGYVHRMLMRLAAKGRAAREGRAMSGVREQEMVNFRRELYRRGVRVRSVRDGGRSRDTSAEFYRRNPACLHRLVPWLKRELVVLYGAHGYLVNSVQHIIMSCITRFDMEDAAIREELRPFLQTRLEHFLHEFISFAKAPFHMEAYDQHAVYDCPAPSSNEGSRSNSSVIAISEDDDEDDGAAEPSRPGESASSLSRSPWDDETPGPSYSTTAEHWRTAYHSVLDSDSDSSAEEEALRFTASPPQTSPVRPAGPAPAGRHSKERVSSDGEDCVIVGFVKPTAERTPELVQLSSDSEESESEGAKNVLPLPRHIRFCSLSPAGSPSSSVAALPENTESDRPRPPDSRTRRSASPPGINKPWKSDRRERDASRDRERRRRKRRAASPDTSSSSFSTHPASGRGPSHPHGREQRRHDATSRRRSSGGGEVHHSVSHYSQQRSESGTRYTERKSYYYSSRKYSSRRSGSRSRSLDSPDRSRSRSDSSSPARSRSHRDKPAGKRKYKSRHLEDSPHAQGGAKKKKSREKRHKRWKERCRKSVSVELVSEGGACERGRRHHKRKKKHKRKSRSHKSSRSERRSPAVITIDSRSDSGSPGRPAPPRLFLSSSSPGPGNPGLVE